MVWEVKGLSHVEFRVLARLADRANEYFVCWPSVSGLAADCEVSESTARRAVHNLARKGVLSFEQSAGRSRPNVYRLELKGVTAVTPLKGVNGDVKGVNGDVKGVTTDVKGVTAVTPESLRTYQRTYKEPRPTSQRTALAGRSGKDEPRPALSVLAITTGRCERCRDTAYPCTACSSAAAVQLERAKRHG
jgi:hypothetical protein